MGRGDGPISSGGCGGRIPDAPVRRSREKLDLEQTSGPSRAPGEHAGRGSEPSPVAGWLQAGAGPETETSRDHMKKTRGQHTCFPRPRERLAKGTRADTGEPGPCGERGPGWAGEQSPAVSRGEHGQGGRGGRRAGQRPPGVHAGSQGTPGTENKPASAETTSACGSITQLTAWTGVTLAGTEPSPGGWSPGGLFPKHHRHLQPADLWPQHSGTEEGQRHQSTPSARGTSVGPPAPREGRGRPELRAEVAGGVPRGCRAHESAQELLQWETGNAARKTRANHPRHERITQETARDSTVRSATRRAVFTSGTGWLGAS